MYRAKLRSRLVLTKADRRLFPSCLLKRLPFPHQTPSMPTNSFYRSHFAKEETGRGLLLLPSGLVPVSSPRTLGQVHTCHAAFSFSHGESPLPRWSCRSRHSGGPTPQWPGLRRTGTPGAPPSLSPRSPGASGSKERATRVTHRALRHFPSTSPCGRDPLWRWFF